MIPGFSGKLKQGAQIDEKQIARTKAIIQSMTPKERRNPEIIKASQKNAYPRVAEQAYRKSINCSNSLK